MVSGKKQFVFQFENVKSLGISDGSTFQTVLTEDGWIFFYYKDVVSLGAGKTVAGICGDSGKDPILIPLFDTAGRITELGVQISDTGLSDCKDCDPEPEPEPEPESEPQPEQPCPDCGETLTVKVPTGTKTIIIDLSEFSCSGRSNPVASIFTSS